MSLIDRRASGLLPPHAFAFEDKHDPGGCVMTAGSLVHMPTHETLDHNRAYGFLNSSHPGVAEDYGCELPDPKEPFAIREAKAVMGRRFVSTIAQAELQSVSLS